MPWLSCLLISFVVIEILKALEQNKNKVKICKADNINQNIGLKFEILRNNSQREIH